MLFTVSKNSNYWKGEAHKSEWSGDLNGSTLGSLTMWLQTSTALPSGYRSLQKANSWCRTLEGWHDMQPWQKLRLIRKGERKSQFAKMSSVKGKQKKMQRWFKSQQICDIRFIIRPYSSIKFDSTSVQPQTHLFLSLLTCTSAHDLLVICKLRPNNA